MGKGSNHTLMYSKTIQAFFIVAIVSQPIIPYFTINEKSNPPLVYVLV